MASDDMDIVQEFKENRRMLLSLENELKELKAEISTKESTLHGSEEKIMNEMFRNLVSLKKEIDEKSEKIKVLEEAAIVQNEDYAKRIKEEESGLEDKNKLIEELKEENKKYKEMLESMKQKPKITKVKEEPTDITVKNEIPVSQVNKEEDPLQPQPDAISKEEEDPFL